MSILGDFDVLVEGSHLALGALEFTPVGVGDFVGATYGLVVSGAWAKISCGLIDQTSQNHNENCQKHG